MLTGRYSEILRVIGRLLDEREALARAEHIGQTGTAPGQDALPLAYEDVQIVEHETFMRVAWRARNGSGARQVLTDLTLSLLHSRALQLRGEAASDPAGEREELLRTLGQELDAGELVVTGIFEKEEEFFVSGSEAGRYFNRPFPKDDLRALSRFRQRLRPAHRETPDGVEPDGAVAARGGWLVWGD